MSAIHVVDTGVFVAMGSPSNSRYEAVRTFARRNDITFVVPERVYEELTTPVSDVETPPIDTAIEEGWVRMADPLGYSYSLVSKVIDGAALHRKRR